MMIPLKHPIVEQKIQKHNSIPQQVKRKVIPKNAFYSTKIHPRNLQSGIKRTVAAAVTWEIKKFATSKLSTKDMRQMHQIH